MSATSNPIVEGSWEDLKRNVRESLVYALYASLKEPWQRRLVIQEFYSSLNRKALLWNDEAEAEVREAFSQLDRLEGPWE